MKLSSNNVTTFHLPEDGSACPSIKQIPAQKCVTHLNKPSAILSVYSNYKKVNFFLVLFVFFSSPGSRLPLITHLLLIKFISCSISTQYSGHSLPDCSVSYLDSDLSGFTCELACFSESPAVCFLWTIPFLLCSRTTILRLSARWNSSFTPPSHTNCPASCDQSRYCLPPSAVPQQLTSTFYKLLCLKCASGSITCQM